MDHLPVPLDMLVEDLHRQASLLGQERDIQVVLRTTASAVVLGDELRLRELSQPFDNAVKYLPRREVDIALTIEQTRRTVSVTDRGIGIAQISRRSSTGSIEPMSTGLYQEGHGPWAVHLRLDCRIPSRAYRGPEQGR